MKATSTVKRGRGRPRIRWRPLVKIPGLMSAYLRKPVGQPPVLAKHEVLMLMSEVDVALSIGFFDDRDNSTTKANSIKEALELISKHKIHEDSRCPGKKLSYQQLRDCYYHTLSDKEFTKKARDFFGEERFARLSERRRKKLSTIL